MWLRKSWVIRLSVGSSPQGTIHWIHVSLCPRYQINQQRSSSPTQLIITHWKFFHCFSLQIFSIKLDIEYLPGVFDTASICTSKAVQRFCVSEEDLLGCGCALAAGSTWGLLWSRGSGRRLRRPNWGSANRVFFCQPCSGHTIGIPWKTKQTVGKPPRAQNRGENTPVQCPALRWAPVEVIATSSSLYTKPVTVCLFGKNQGCSHYWLEDAVYDLWPKVMKYTTCRNQRKHTSSLYHC